MKKKIVAILSVIMATFLLMGCQSEVNLYNYPSDNGNTLVLEFYLENKEAAALDASAKREDAVPHNGYLQKMGYLRTFSLLTGAGQPWTVEQYIHAVMETRTNFEFNDKDKDGDNTSISFIIELTDDADDDSEEGGDEEEEDTSAMTVEKGFFMYHVKVEQDGIFNYYKQQYYNGGTEDNSAIGVIKNGLKEAVPLNKDAENYETRKQELLANGYNLVRENENSELYEILIIPSFEDAFPLAKGVNTYSASLLKTNYILQSNNKMTTSGQTLYDNSGNKYYMFGSYFDDKEDKIIYEYVRANSVGWNVLAICIGLAAVGGLMLYCKFRKPKEPKKTAYAQAKERFPYDPYENVDPFAEYNGKKSGDDNDNNPFAGY